MSPERCPFDNSMLDLGVDRENDIIFLYCPVCFISLEELVL